MGKKIILTTKAGNNGGVAGLEASVNESAFTTAAAKVINKNVAAFNRKSPKILRQAMREAISADLELGPKYAGDWIERLKSELRPVGTIKAGSGIKLRFTDNRLEVRYLLTRTFLEQDLGRDGTFYFIMKSFGFSGGLLPARDDDTAYPMAVKEDPHSEKTKGYDGKKARLDNKVDPERRSNMFIVFARGPMLIPEQQATATWPDKAIEIAKQKILKL
jgi:hypothetical protein